jgi:hypothetical protein
MSGGLDSSGETDAILGSPEFEVPAPYRGAIDVSGIPYYDNGGFFTATQVAAAVPDGASTIALLGLALAGLGSMKWLKASVR